MTQKRTRRVLLGIATSLLFSNSHAVRQSLFEVESSGSSSSPQQSLRARRESFKKEEDAIEAEETRRIRKSASIEQNDHQQHHRRTQTMIETLNHRTHRVGVDSFYHRDPKPNRPLVETSGMRLNKVAEELFLDDKMLGEMLEVTMNQFSMVSIFEIIHY